jgi:hypothetical protein
MGITIAPVEGFLPSLLARLFIAVEILMLVNIVNG